MAGFQTSANEWDLLDILRLQSSTIQKIKSEAEFSANLVLRVLKNLETRKFISKSGSLYSITSLGKRAWGKG